MQQSLAKGVHSANPTEYPTMTGHQINSLVGDLVAMAQAMERLPQVEAELYTKGNEVVDWQRRYDIIAQDLEQSRSYAASLEAKVHSAEVARDDAELRFLELDERAAKAVRFLGQVQGMAVQAELELSPPKPLPEPQPEPVKEWSGSPDPVSPDTHWINDATGERVAADASPQGQSESDPIPTVEPVNSTPTDTAPMVDGPFENAAPMDTVQQPSSSGPYSGRRYIDYPGYVRRDDWLAGGGTNEDYDFCY